MRKVNYGPDERTPYFLSVDDHDDRFPLTGPESAP
jgi:hypothetical protein